MRKLSKLLSIILISTIMSSTLQVEASSVKSNTERLAGKSRVETSIEVSKKAYPNPVDVVLLAGYNGEADALTGTVMAGQLKAPLLFSTKTKVSGVLLKEIKRLNPKKIYLLGDESVVSNDVKKGLESQGFKTVRLGGKSRIQTSVKVAEESYKTHPISEVFIIEYNSLVDALSIGPVSARDGIPVLISYKDKLPIEIINFITNKNINKATIVGGNLKDNVKTELKKHVKTVDTVSGANRVETSLLIAKKYFKKPDTAFVANGYKNIDALIGGYIAAKYNGPILLSNKDSISNNVLNYLSNNIYNKKAFVLGEEDIINNNVKDLINQSIQDEYDVILPQKPGGNEPAEPNPSKPEDGSNIPKDIPKGAVLIDSNAAEQFNYFKYKVNLPSGGYINKVSTNNSTEGCFAMAEGYDKNNKEFMVQVIAKTNSINYKFNKPSFTEADNRFVFEQLNIFLDAYGYND